MGYAPLWCLRLVMAPRGQPLRMHAWQALGWGPPFQGE